MKSENEVQLEKRMLPGSPVAYFISDEGHDEWVLFLHAAFVTHEMFRMQFGYFRDKYNILAVDIIGHGLSTDTRKGDSILKMSEWTSGILKAEGIDKVHIAGVSLGAVLAQDFANRYPDSVSSLACFGGYDIKNFDTDIQKENSSRQMLMMLKALFSVKWFAKANRKISAYTPQAQDEFYDMNIRFRKKSFMFLAGLDGMINRHRTGKRNYPLLVGCGRHDIPMELDVVETWHAAEPDSRMVIFENAGHCVNMDVPMEFNRTLESFWKESCPKRIPAQE